MRSETALQAIAPQAITEAAALKTLRLVLQCPDATWTCEGQKNAVMATLNVQRDVLCVMATGAGKTMQVILASLLQPTYATVVVLPLKALVQDYSRRLTELKIPFQVWSTVGNEFVALNDTSNLILVMIDQAQKDVFTQVITHYHDRSKYSVKRWIFDEAHYAFTSANFRPSLTNLQNLRAILPVQFVLMSGTIPPATTAVLQKSYALMSTFLEIRTDTLRPELQYIIAPFVETHKDLCNRVAKYVDFYTSEFRSEDRGLIYCDTKASLTELKKTLGFPSYQGGSDANKERRDILDQQRQLAHTSWIAGDTSQWLLCTSAFAAGVDYAHVRVTIIAGTPREMINAQQECGRAARDKLHAVAIIIPWADNQMWSSSKSPHTGIEEMHNLIYESHYGREACIRFMLSNFNDGVGTTCADLPDAAYCSNCFLVEPNEAPPLTFHHYHYSSRLLIHDISAKKRSAEQAEREDKEIENNTQIHHHESKKHKVQHVEVAETADEPIVTNDSVEAAHINSRRQKARRAQDTIHIISTLKAILEQFKNTCLWCDWVNKTEHHPLDKCETGQRRKGAYFDWKKFIRYERHTTSTSEHPNMCFYCGVPQIMNLHSTFQSGPEHCQWKDIILPVLWKVCEQEDVFQDAKEEFSQNWQDSKAFARWLSQRTISCIPNTIHLFIWYMTECRVDRAV